MELTLEDPAEMDLRIFEIPLSGIRLNGQKIKYYDFISSLKYPGCNAALYLLFKRTADRYEANLRAD